MRKFTGILVIALTLQPFAPAFGSTGFQKDRGQSGSKNSEDVLKREVRHELLLLPQYSVFDYLVYAVNGYQVTLSGQVTRPSLKSDAEAVVKRIEGVEGVNNQIEVLPNSPMDDDIRRATLRAIYGQDMLQRYGFGSVQSIHIIVKNGNVTLEGYVDSEGDRTAAGMAANSVPNVFSATNHLIVSSSK